jgi:hypothetical protein
MPNNNSRPEILALLIFSLLPEEITETEARTILLESEEFDHISAGECITELIGRGNLYKEEGESGVLIGLTELGETAAEAFTEERKHYSHAINKALRAYRRLITGIEYRIGLSREGNGSYVSFERLDFGEQKLFLRLFFDKSGEALEAYNRMDSDPDAFYKGYVTVATGKIDFLI